MRLEIAPDPADLFPKEELLVQLRAAGHDGADFGAHELSPSDDYPDIRVSLARVAVARTYIATLQSSLVASALRFVPTGPGHSCRNDSRLPSFPTPRTELKPFLHQIRTPT